MVRRFRRGLVRRLRKAGWQLRRRRDMSDVVARALAGMPVELGLDLGANKGDTVALWRRLFPSARIVAFEPFEGCVAELRRRFGNDAAVTIEPKAVGNRAGRVALNVSMGQSTHSLRTRPDNRYGPHSGAAIAGVQEVELITLDDWARQEGVQHVDLLKIDVEGYEAQVIEGAKSLLASGSADVVVCEVMFVPLYDGQSLFHTLTTQLEALGYDLYDLTEIRHASDGQARWGNAVYLSRPYRQHRLG